MNKKIYVFVFIRFVIGFVSTGVYSQTNQITLSTNPNGAKIEMKGEYIITGVTPLKIPYDLTGVYKIKSSRNGYENWSAIYDFSGNNSKDFFFKLKPKTRFKAGLRSIFFPGWGQFYSDRKIQGFLISGLELTSALYTIKKITDHNRIIENYDKLLGNYNKTNLTYQKRQNLKNQLINQEIKAEEAYDKKQMWIYILASVWTYNILDAIVFFGYDNLSLSSDSLSMASGLSAGPNIAVNLKWNF